MPRSSNQKFKGLYLAKIFAEKTDDNHALTALELVAELATHNIPANRKSIYDDIAALKDFGLDIQLRLGKGGGYYLASRDFELPELKLLVDAVLSSRLITGKKSRLLIDKISKLTSAAQATELCRQIHVSGRVKAPNEHIYYSIDAIHAAINSGRKISFKYFDYDVQKRRVYRKSGEAYTRTPVALVWNEDKYYLVAYSAAHEDALASYRVDRMASVEVLTEAADKYDRKRYNLADYVRHSFGMYAGELVTARLSFDVSLVNTVLDYFGSETRLIPMDDGRFCIDVEVSESPVFLAWVFQFGSKAEILAPEGLRTKLRDMAAGIAERYGR